MSRVTIYGARGSYPVSGERVRRYGGSTSCLSLETPQGLIIIDAGTGLAALSEVLAQRPVLPPITLLFTHFHLDHVIGLPSFAPFRQRGADITLATDPMPFRGWRRRLTTLMGSPFWPVGLLKAGAKIRFHDLPQGARTGVRGPWQRYGVDISWCPVAHPQGCIAYRCDGPNGTVVIGTDREHGDRRLDPAFRVLCHGANVLIHDAQYTPDEYPQRIGWGHSTWEEAAKVAAAARAQSLVLTSHDPGRSDEAIDRVVEQARGIFANTVAASEQLPLETAGTTQALGRASGRRR